MGTTQTLHQDSLLDKLKYFVVQFFDNEATLNLIVRNYSQIQETMLSVEKIERAISLESFVKRRKSPSNAWVERQNTENFDDKVYILSHQLHKILFELSQVTDEEDLRESIISAISELRLNASQAIRLRVEDDRIGATLEKRVDDAALHESGVGTASTQSVEPKNTVANLYKYFSSEECTDPGELMLTPGNYKSNLPNL